MVVTSPEKPARTHHQRLRLQDPSHLQRSVYLQGTSPAWQTREWLALSRKWWRQWPLSSSCRHRLRAKDHKWVVDNQETKGTVIPSITPWRIGCSRGYWSTSEILPNSFFRSCSESSGNAFARFPGIKADHIAPAITKWNSSTHCIIIYPIRIKFYSTDCFALHQSTSRRLAGSLHVAMVWMCFVMYITSYKLSGIIKEREREKMK